MVTIALDAMGGDHAPAVVVEGALEALREPELEVLLVGPKQLLAEELQRRDAAPARLRVVEASQVVGMGESPSEAFRHKRDSSISVGLGLIKRGEAEGFVSAGNSGAVVAAAVAILGLLPGVERPALGMVFRSLAGPLLLLDVGATVSCKPHNLLQFALMGSAYMERVLGIARPRVGLLSNGEEPSKGPAVVKAAHRLLRLQAGVNFVGNVEGKDLPKGTVQVVVTDGFTGNIVLKTSEGMTELFYQMLGESFASAPHFAVAGFILKPALKEMAKSLDYSEYGGAPLLGVGGVVVVAHGRSDAKAIKNAVLVAKHAVEVDALAALQLEGLSQIPDEGWPEGAAGDVPGRT
ncbi:MAG: phosphate acyltransferase PlsX [Dehalococcoidia bacterium]|nr:phosphate acyltransferase PlsX [Dehalococcoidia bacterium]